MFDMNKLPKGAKGVNAAVAKAVANYAKAREGLHFAAVACVAHAAEHGDVRPLHTMLESMGERSQTRHRIAAWVRHHFTTTDENGKDKTMLLATINPKDGTIRVQIRGDEGKSFVHSRLQAAADEPYWDVVQVTKVSTDWELKAKLIALVKQAKKHDCDDASIREAMEEALKAA